MSRNGSGVYNLPTGNPVVTGTTIASNWANTTLSDLATAMTGSVAADGQTPITGNLQMGGNKITGMADGSSLTDAATVGQGAAVNSVMTGTIQMWPTTSAPTGYLLCAGAAVSRTTYAALFAIIGTTFGSGDGSTTFNLPDTRRKVRVGKGGTGTATLANTTGSTGGAETHTLTVTEIPAHTHTYTRPNYLSTYDSSLAAQGSNSSTGGIATGSTGGDGAHNNMQPSIVMMTIIKY